MNTCESISYTWWCCVCCSDGSHSSPTLCQWSLSQVRSVPEKPRGLLSAAVVLRGNRPPTDSRLLPSLHTDNVQTVPNTHRKGKKQNKYRSESAGDNAVCQSCTFQRKMCLYILLVGTWAQGSLCGRSAFLTYRLSCWPCPCPAPAMCACKQIAFMHELHIHQLWQLGRVTEKNDTDFVWDFFLWGNGKQREIKGGAEELHRNS